MSKASGGRMDRLAQQLDSIWPDLGRRAGDLDLEIEANQSLARFCYYQAGGQADFLAKPQSLAQCVKVLDRAKAMGWPVMPLGLGSNMLVSDEGISGLVVMTTGMDRLYFRDGLIWAEMGASMADLVAFAAANSRGDYSSLVGIPGTVGGGIYMNAGAYDQQISDSLSGLVLYDLDLGRLVLHRTEPGDFAYRMSFIQKHNYFILAAAFDLGEVNQAELLTKMAEVQTKRRRSQPLALPSCGSAFKRPEGHYVGKLISDLGLKGKRHGQVGISAKHAGFIVNYGGATAREIGEFFVLIRQEVKAAYGIDLVPEVRWVGRWSQSFLRQFN